MKAITLCVTTECNFGCGYCSQKRLYNQVCARKNMPDEIAKKAEGLVEENGRIGFFGGEPMLRIDLLRKVIGRNPNKRFTVTSNGSGEFKDYAFLIKNSCFLVISYDGKLSDREKEDKTFRTIKKLSSFASKNLRIRITLSLKSIGFFSETVNELTECGAKNIFFEPDDSINFNNKEVLDKFRNGIEPTIDYWFSHPDLNLMTASFFRGPCVVRGGNDCYILPDGKIFLCHKELTQKRYVGNLLTDSLDKIRASIERKKVVCPTKSLCLWQEEKIKGWNKFRSFLFNFILEKKGGM